MANIILFIQGEPGLLSCLQLVSAATRPVLSGVTARPCTAPFSMLPQASDNPTLCRLRGCSATDRGGTADWRRNWPPAVALRDARYGNATLRTPRIRKRIARRNRATGVQAHGAASACA